MAASKPGSTKGLLHRSRDVQNESPELNAMAHRDLLQALRPVVARLTDVATDSNERATLPTPTPLKMSWQLLLPSAELLDQERLSMVAQIYTKEYEIGNEILSMILNDCRDEAGFEESGALWQSATREQIQYTTNTFTRATLLTASVAPDKEQLLDDFFDTCQSPNPAEIGFLARICRTSDEAIHAYFKGRSEQLRSFFAARYTASGDEGHSILKEDMDKGPRKISKPLLAH